MIVRQHMHWHATGNATGNATASCSIDKKEHAAKKNKKTTASDQNGYSKHTQTPLAMQQ